MRKIYLIFILMVSFKSLEATSNIGAEISIDLSKSDNLSKNKLEKIKGELTRIKGSFYGSKKITNSSYLLYNAAVEKKHHFKKIHAKNFNETIFVGELGFSKETFWGHQFTFQLYGQKFDGREIDFILNSSEGKESKYFEYGGKVSLDKRLQYYLYGLSFHYSKRDFSTLSNDENGNTFEDDSRSHGISINNKIFLQESVEISVNPSFEETRSQERRSRFTEGTLDNSGRNPLQKIRKWSFPIGLTYKGSLVTTKLNLGYIINDDIEFGALDYKEKLAQLILEIPITSKILFRPSFGISEKKYDTFVADVISNPQANEKRIDKVKVWNIPVDFSLFGGTFTLEYKNEEIISNYPLEGYNEKQLNLRFKHELL